MLGGFIDTAVEQILDIRETLCTDPLNPYNQRASEYELERQIKRTAAQLLPNHLRGLAQYITSSSLERYIGLASPSVNVLFPDSNPKSRLMPLSEGDILAIMLAAYQLAIIYDGPEVVLIYAGNSDNKMLATLAGLVLINEREQQPPQMDRMQYHANISLAARTSWGRETLDPRIFSAYMDSCLQ